MEIQEEVVCAVEKVLGTGGGALLIEDRDMGTGPGKRFHALSLLLRGKVGTMFPALVVCPLALNGVWEHEAAKAGLASVQVLKGRPLDEALDAPGELGLTSDVLLINPEKLATWLPYLRRLGLKTLVLDGCRSFGNHKARRTQAMITLARYIPYRIAVSSPCITNRLIQLWPTLYMLRPDMFPRFFDFANEYCSSIRTYWGVTYNEAMNPLKIKGLQGLLHETCMVTNPLERETINGTN